MLDIHTTTTKWLIYSQVLLNSFMADTLTLLQTLSKENVSQYLNPPVIIIQRMVLV